MNNNNNFISQKPPVENVKNTINERLNQFMFNPYLCQQTAPPIPTRHSVITKTKYEDTSVELGRKDTFDYITKHSSLFQQDDAFAGITQMPSQAQQQQYRQRPQTQQHQHQHQHQQPQQQQQPQQPQTRQPHQHQQYQQRPRNVPLDRSPAIFQTSSYNNYNTSSNNALERSLQLNQQSYNPVFDHRPSNTRLDSTNAHINYQQEMDKRQNLINNNNQYHNRS